MGWLDGLLGRKARSKKPAPGAVPPTAAASENARPPFHARSYEVYALLSSADAPPAWTKSSWLQIRSALDPLVQRSRDQPAVRTSQLRVGAGSPNQRAIKFGRIGWGDSGVEKWTHDGDGRLVSSGEPAEFLSSEVWAPSWSACEREGVPPDVFFGLANQGAFGPTPQFGSICILAVAADMTVNSVDSPARESAEAIASILRPVLKAHSARTWGVASGERSFTSAINDLVVVGLFKPGPRQSAAPTLSLLSGNWEPF